MIKFVSISYFVMITGCAFVGLGHKQPIKTLNNNGGISHGGLMIKLMDDGSASVTTYSDAIGDSKSRRGTYDLNDDLLLIRYRNGDVTVLRKVIYKDQEYWVHPNEISQLTENSAEGVSRRRVALKTKREQVASSNH